MNGLSDCADSPLFLKTDINIYKLLEQNLLFFYVMIRLVRTGANIDENV